MMDPRGPEEGDPIGQGQGADPTVAEAGTGRGQDRGPAAPPEPDPAPGDATERGEDREATGQGEAGSPAEGLARELERLQEELAAARREADQRLEQLKRVQADFANYRRRMMQEQARWREQAIGDFVVQLLPAVDNLERALTVASEGDPLKEGVAMVHRQMLEIFARAGIEPIPAEGQAFDPRLHEAVAREETAQVPDGHVIEVFQRGYLYQGRTLRPALVKVAVAPAAAQRADADATSPAGAGASTADPGVGAAGDDAGQGARDATGLAAGRVAAEQDGAEEATRG